MASTPLMSQWDSLMCELFSKGFLNDDFKKLEKLEDKTAPNFVSETVSIYCEYGDMPIKELIKLFKQPNMDYEKIYAHINNLIGSSASVGALRVKISARQLLRFWLEGNKKGCNMALAVVRTEFSYTCAKLKDMIELKQKIRQLFDPKKKLPEQGSAAACSHDK